MNLLRAIYCLFGSRCVPEEAKSTGDSEPPVPADLGQKEAELEKAGKEQMGYKEGGDASKSAEQEPTRRSPTLTTSLPAPGTKRTSWIVVKSPTQSVARRTCACASCVDLSRRGVDPTTNNAASNALLEVPTERIPLRPR